MAIRGALGRGHTWRGLLAGLVLATAPFLGPGRAAVAEDLASPTARLGAVMSLMDRTTETQELRGTIDARAIPLRFTRMSPGMYARYSLARHTIEIDETWSDAAPETLAAVVAHESVHARDAVNGYLSSGGATACIDSELRAFRTSAALWVEMFGPKGKPAPLNDLERQLNLIAERQGADPNGLEALVRQAYADQCS